MKKLRLRFIRLIWKFLGAHGVGKDYQLIMTRRGIFYNGQVTYQAGTFRARVWRKAGLGQRCKYPRIKDEYKDGFRDAWSAAEWAENQIPFGEVT